MISNTIDSDWDGEGVSEEEPGLYATDDDNKLDRIMRSKHGDRQDYSKYATKVIDARRYYVFVTPLRNNFQILWVESAQLPHMEKYKDAVKKTREIEGRRPLRTSRTSQVSRHRIGECKTWAE